MECKHNGIAPSTDGERTTLHSLPEAPQHHLYYCAFTSTSFLFCRLNLTNILPVKTSLEVHQAKIAECAMGKGESLLIPLPLKRLALIPSLLKRVREDQALTQAYCL